MVIGNVSDDLKCRNSFRANLEPERDAFPQALDDENKGIRKDRHL